MGWKGGVGRDVQGRESWEGFMNGIFGWWWLELVIVDGLVFGGLQILILMAGCDGLRLGLTNESWKITLEISLRDYNRLSSMPR